MPRTSEYEVEMLFIDRLESIGYEYVDMKNYDDVLSNFRKQLARFNAAKLLEKKGEASFSDAEFDRIKTLVHVTVNRGLDAGTYYLVETDAPAGYIKAQNGVKIEIKAVIENVEHKLKNGCLSP